MQNILIVGVMIVVLGGGAWLLFSDSKPSSDQSAVQTSYTSNEAVTENLTDSQSEIEGLAGMGSLASILGFGDTVRCDFSSSAEGFESTGIFYTDGERMRVDSTSVSPTGAIESNTINDGEFVFAWGETPEGAMAFKMLNQEPSEGEVIGVDDSMPESQSYVDVDKEVEYTCDNWNVDETVFVPPSDVEFMDMAAMMQGAVEGLPDGFELPEGMEEMMR